MIHLKFIFKIVFFFFLQAASPRWEPQIATLCEAGQQYHPQHLSEDGRWTTDLSIKTPATTCLRDKMDLLDHCKKVSTKQKKKICFVVFFFIEFTLT